MRNVLVLGASGSLARFVIDDLMTLNDIHLTLFLRNKRKLYKSNVSGSTIIEGDVLNYDALKKAVTGQDIVYVNLSGNLEAMAKNIIKAMKETGVRRIIAISSIGIYDSPLSPILLPYRRLADVIEESGLDYTILRPDWFTHANEIDYTLTRKGEPEIGQAISRKSIAAFISKIVTDPDLYKNENLGISKPN